jgi:hypothetical protein
MKKFTSLFLVFSLLLLSGGLFANEKENEFSLAIKNVKLPKLDLDSFSANRDFLFSIDLSLLTSLPKYNNVSLNYSESSSFWKGAWKGALIGGAVMAVLALITCKPDDSLGYKIITMGFSCGQIVLLSFVGGAVIGGIIGGIIEVNF